MFLSWSGGRGAANVLSFALFLNLLSFVFCFISERPDFVHCINLSIVLYLLERGIVL